MAPVVREACGARSSAPLSEEPACPLSAFQESPLPTAPHGTRTGSPGLPTTDSSSVTRGLRGRGRRIHLALAAMALACSEAGPSRPYALAASGTQLLVSGPELGFQLTDANLASDVDLIAVHQEYYGVPWTELEPALPTPRVGGKDVSARRLRPERREAGLPLGQPAQRTPRWARGADPDQRGLDCRRGWLGSRLLRISERLPTRRPGVRPTFATCSGWSTSSSRGTSTSGSS